MPLNFTIDDLSPLIIYKPPEAWFQGNASTDSPPSPYWGNTKTWTQTPAASATFVFNGTGVTVVGAKRSNHGRYMVQIDHEDPETFDGFMDPDQIQTQLFNTTDKDLSYGHHQVVVTHAGDEGTYLDIDCIHWFLESSDTNKQSHGSDAPRVQQISQDTESAFTYGPKGSWNMQPQNLAQFNDATGHSTSQTGAIVNYTFTGQAVSIYGTIGAANGQYTVYLDDQLKGSFNGTRAFFTPQVMLYYADGLGNGTHVLSLSNEQEGKLLEIDYAIASDVSSATIIFPSTSSSPSPHKMTVVLTTGVILGIAFTILIFFLLILLLWVLNRRNKTLWHRLNRGYMVQSQFDSPQPSTRPLLLSQHVAQGSHSSTNSWKSQMHQQYRDENIQPDPPSRSDTDSTLVAENGSVWSSAPVKVLTLKLLPRWGNRGRVRDSPPIAPVQAQSRKRLLLDVDVPLSNEEEEFTTAEPAPPAYHYQRTVR
ncbi:hypothetical protein C8J56DRAFT_925327 [Mycena floridula]|nr:hypothetical protein C8J56DRAFT_925327 [Mycena floridula]